MDFYSVVLKKSGGYWVALCLENWIVAQGDNPEQSMSKLQEAIESFLLVCETEEKVDQSPISILELHEFLTIKYRTPTLNPFNIFFFIKKEWTNEPESSSRNYSRSH